MNDSEHAQNQADRDVDSGAAIDAGESHDSGGDHPAPREIGGRKGPDPVRYGDWEKNGRCIDF